MRAAFFTTGPRDSRSAGAKGSFVLETNAKLTLDEAHTRHVARKLIDLSLGREHRRKFSHSLTVIPSGNRIRSPSPGMSGTKERAPLKRTHARARVLENGAIGSAHIAAADCEIHDWI